MTLPGAFLAAARGSDQPFLEDGTAARTHGEVVQLAAAIAGLLRDRGVGRGDRVALIAPNSVTLATALYGTWFAGAAFAVLHPATRPDRVHRVLANLDPALVVADARATARAGAVLAGRVVVGLEEVGALPPTEPPDTTPAIAPDLAAVIYTSGSTGAPKGVAVTHANMRAASECVLEYLPTRPDDLVLSALSLSTSYGLYQVLLAGHGGYAVRLEEGFAFPGRIIELLQTRPVTAVPGVPTLFAMLAGRDATAFPGVRYVTNAGAAIAPAQIEAVRRLFPAAAFYAMYGQTECKRATYLPPEELDRRPSSAGIAIPGTELWLVDEDGAPITAPGHVGELVVRGPHVMAGYWGDPVATAAKLRPGPYPWEHVLHTGDLFRRDEDGFFYFVGRGDDIIKSRGEKVAPREVEEAILRLAGVREVAVVGVSDAVLGAVVVAHVVLHDGATLTDKDVRAHCAGLLDDVAIPKRVEFHLQLPRTPAGKVDATALRDV